MRFGRIASTAPHPNLSKSPTSRQSDVPVMRMCVYGAGGVYAVIGAKLSNPSNQNLDGQTKRGDGGEVQHDRLLSPEHCTRLLEGRG
jgi:hypothetical protein